MKKIGVVFSLICVLILGGVYSDICASGGSCSFVSGASVNGSYNYNKEGEKIGYKVTLSNHSGSTCSASCVVEGKTSNGTWEVLEEMILSAENNNSSSNVVDIRGYVAARVVNVSTWKCD